MPVSTLAATLFPFMFIFIAMVVLLCIPSHILNREKSLVYSMLVLSLVYFSSEMLGRLFVIETSFFYGRLIFCVICYAIIPFVLLLFYDLAVGLDRKSRWMWALPCLQTAIFIYSFFSQVSTFLPNLGIEFSYNNVPKYGYLYGISILVPVYLISATAVKIYMRQKNREISSSEANIIYFLLSVNIVAWMMESFLNDVYLVGTVVFISIVIYYAFLYIYNFKIYEEEVLKKHEIEIAISQIHPHFIYNTLNSIYYLCGKDDELAKKTIDDFSTYLRKNLSSLSDTSFIPVEEELRHTEAYLSIEKLRFGERLNYRFEIDETDFKVPPLILQPLVENAVKHGVCQKAEGGTVTVKICKEDKKTVIRVIDDGVGFDPSAIRTGEGSHIGITNTRQRIEKLLGGTLTVESERGKGATVTVAF